MKKKFSRRDFVKGSLAGVGGLIALETLQSCTPSLPPQEGDDVFKPGPDVHGEFPMEFTETRVPTTCWIGKQDCGMFARVLTQTVGGKEIKRIVGVEGHPDHPRNRGRLCPKGVAQIAAVYDYNRIKAPLKRVNRKGEPGRFVQVSWDEALDIVASELDESRSSGTPILWQKGRSKAKSFYDKAFVSALEDSGLSIPTHGHGAFCSDAGYRGAEYTLGLHGVLHPDFRHTKYLLAWGWGLTTSGGNKYCWLTWPQFFQEARQNNLEKVVSLDPFRRGTGPHADEWLPNRPGTDVAFFLGIAHYLIMNGFVDHEHLVNHSNAPFLVGEDGNFARVTVEEGGEQVEKELVWDQDAGQAVPFDTDGVSGALEGEFTVDGAIVKPAFQRLKDRLQAQGTSPDWADQVCGLPALTTARIAREMYENAHIGETITVDGVTMPYRPVAIMAYHVAQQERGFTAVRAAIQVLMLLGAVDVPGGSGVDFAPGKAHKNWTKHDSVSIQDTDLDFRLGGSKFFPISSGCPSFSARVMLEPTRYDVDPSTIPNKMILFMADPLTSFTDVPILEQAYSKMDFMLAISPWLSNTADRFADVILPAATLEKYEGPMSASTPYEKSYTLRVPPVPPLWDSKGDIAIHLDIAERAGILTGPGGFIDHLNAQLGLEENALPLSSKPTERDIFDRWAKEKDFGGIEFFETEGVTESVPHDVSVTYAYNWGYPGRHRLYGESLKNYQETMQSLGVDEIYSRDYTAFPEWRPATMEQSPRSFDLYLISYKQVEFKQSRASFVPILAELSPTQGLVINPKAARSRGIKEGDEVYVESQNAITGEVRWLKTKARLYNSIRPDTVALSHHYGLAPHGQTGPQGPSPNHLFFASEGYIQCTQDASFQVKVRVYKA